jgi:hypothetical protein
MKGFLILAGITGFALLAYILVKNRQASAALTAPSVAAPSGTQPLTLYQKAGNYRDATSQSPWSLKPSAFVEGHVARKDAIAPYVLAKVGVPASVAKPIANIAGKLDVSGYAERWVSNEAGSVFHKIGL